jgi:glycosyltransferase involved in cell wall biosynthesis
MSNLIKTTVIPVHYNYHGYLKQMVIKANCYQNCETKYIVLLDSDLLLKKPLNFKYFLKENGKIEWKYLSKHDDTFNSVFTVWNKACEDSNKCPKNEHYMSNGFPFIFTRNSLEEAADKFEQMHNCDYETYCWSRCDNEGVKVDDKTTDKFHKLCQVFTEFEYLGFYCHHYSSDYIFTKTPYCRMDAQFQKNDDESYFIQNWSHGGINEEILNLITKILHD